jgi:hypothetical protein
MIKLNAIEQGLVLILVEKRREENLKSDYTFEDMNLGDNNAEEKMKNAIGAELAFCKLVNSYPDLQYKDRRISDTRLSNGKTVDVKNTDKEEGNLLVPLWKDRKQSDIYVLMIGTFPEYRCAGYAAKDEVFLDQNISDPGLHGRPVYFVRQVDLAPITALHLFLRKEVK